MLTFKVGAIALRRDRAIFRGHLCALLSADLAWALALQGSSYLLVAAPGHCGKLPLSRTEDARWA